MKPMILTALMALAFVFSSPAQKQTTHQPQTKAQAEVRHVQNELIRAYMENDPAGLDRLLAVEYTFTDDLGSVVNKGQILRSFRSGERRIFSYKLQDDEVRVYGNAAVMTYRYASKETYKGKDDSCECRITRVFVKKNGHWQIVAGQETRIASR